MKVAVDAMGGDNAPEVIVEGAVWAAKELALEEVILVGDQERVERELSKYRLEGAKVTIVHAPQVVEMHEPPARALRAKRDSSVSVAVDLMKEGRSDAVVTAGNSGAAMAVSMWKLKKLEGVERPALASIHPTLTGVSVLIDAGGNVDCKPIHLVQFAIMGEMYARFISAKAHPRVGLLSNGTEDSKGNELTKTVHAILKKSGLNYIGYVEGRDIYSGTADVIVCDGFVGNVALKSSEGIAESFGAMLKREIQRSLWARIGYFFMRSALENFKHRVDYSEYGGVPLLGINGTCFICHGHSSAKAIKNAIRAASEYVRRDINRLLIEALRDSHELKKFAGGTATKIWEQIKERVMH
ncbi:MAG: phosphate acyltransferase PlsX [Deltaproteobacteria bacterium]|nr:MAG: phosphate acyltransferase PlsX [Deltaproteobacteria bacterium]